MGVGAGQLERSVLERKTADELHAIATTLGGKPASRAKKADVIDLILELAGVIPTTGPSDVADAATAVHDEAADGDAGGAAGGGGATQRTRRRNPRPSQDDPPQAPDGSGVPDESGVPDASGQVDAGKPAAARTDDAQRPAGPPAEGRSGAPASAAGADHDQRKPRGEGGSKPAMVEAASGPTDGQAGGEADAERDEAEQDELRPDDGEPGNRRRRRRGRDRDRTERPDEAFQAEPVDVEGILDLRDEGYGFLRLSGFLPSKDDVYVSVKQVRQFGLRKGDIIKGAGRAASRNEKNPALLRIDAVNGADPEQIRSRPSFEALTPLFPDERLRLEHRDDPYNMTSRIIDLIAPIGKGQRGLIVSPPKAGKTTVMKQIARSIERNNPEVELIVLLIDERPEEVTDMRRWLKRGEVAASTFDRPADEHTMVAELVIERAKRMVEEGKDVVIILDGITRLARAYNLAAPATGRIMSGGIDTGALYPPKKFFGAARNCEEGGSLTILATALVDTGSRMDEVIFEEFKGTGNMELRLDRRAAERRIYPAIDVDASSTRHEELLFERSQLQMVWKLRRVLGAMDADGAGSGAGLEMLIDRLQTFRSNDEFLAEVAKGPGGA